MPVGQDSSAPQRRLMPEDLIKRPLAQFMTPESFTALVESIRTYNDAIARLQRHLPLADISPGSVDFENLMHDDPLLREDVEMLLRTLREALADIIGVMLGVSRELVNAVLSGRVVEDLPWEWQQHVLTALLNDKILWGRTHGDLDALGKALQHGGTTFR